MTNIHPSSVIEKGAKIAKSAKIGPFCTVSKNAIIGENVELVSNVAIMGNTTIGDGTRVFPFATLGAGAQHLSHMDNKDAKLIIGKNNVIREHVTMHLGTPLTEECITIVGDNGLFMVNSHVAHDCVVGNNVIMTNNAVIAGHVTLEDGCILGGNSAVHQFCRIGTKAMVGGMTGVERDVIPYGMAIGDRAKLAGLNVVGLKRSGVDKSGLSSIRTVYNLLFKSELTMHEALEKVEKEYNNNEYIKNIIEFIKKDTHRKFCSAR